MQTIIINLKILIWNILFILCLSFEFITPHTIFSNIALLSFVTYSICNIDYRHFKIYYFEIIYILFLAICWLGCRWSINQELSKDLCSTITLNLLFIVCLFVYYNSNKIISIIKSLAISVLFSSLFMIIKNAILTGTIIMRGNSYLNVNILAFISAICFLLILTEEIELYYKFPLLLFILVFILVSGTRKAILALVVGLSLYILLNNPTKIVRNIIITICLIGLSYYLLLYVPLFYNLIGYRLDSLRELIQGGEGGASETSRLDYINLGLEYIKLRPLQGYGVNTFRTIKGSYGNYSHNNYIELLFSTGLIGTVLYYLIHFKVLVTSIIKRIKLKNKYCTISIAIIIVLLIGDYAMVSYYERSLIIILVLAYYYSLGATQDSLLKEMEL